MKQSGAERTGVRMRAYPSNDTWDLSPADPTGPRFRIEDIYPCVDGGRYPVKRIAGESVEVWADIFREGHDVLAAALLWRPEADGDWRREPMRLHSNDRWQGRFTPPEPGWYLFAIEAWTDQYATWRKEFRLKQEAGQDVSRGGAGRPPSAHRADAARARGAAGGRDGGAQVRRQPRTRRCCSTTSWRRRSRRPTTAPTSPAATSCRWSPTASAPAPAPGTRWCRAARARCPASTAPSTTASRGCRKSPTSASTCSISRPSIRSATPTARARTTRSRPARTTPAASMPSATSTAATTPSIPSSAPSTTSAGWSRLAPSTIWKWRSTSRCSARPTIRG